MALQTRATTIPNRPQPPRCLIKFLFSALGNRYFLYTLSVVMFLALWDLAAVKKY